MCAVCMCVGVCVCVCVYIYKLYTFMQYKIII